MGNCYRCRLGVLFSIQYWTIRYDVHGLVNYGLTVPFRVRFSQHCVIADAIGETPFLLEYWSPIDWRRAHRASQWSSSMWKKCGHSCYINLHWCNCIRIFLLHDTCLLEPIFAIDKCLIKVDYSPFAFRRTSKISLKEMSYWAPGWTRLVCILAGLCPCRNGNG